MSAKLPKTINYLQPYVNYLESLDPNEIDESIDTSQLVAAIKQRLHKLQLKKLLSTLENDMFTLNEWIGKQSEPHPALFISSFIQVDEVFIDYIKKQDIKKNTKHVAKKKIKFTSGVPEGFDVDKYQDAIIFTLISNKSMICSISLETLNEKLLKSYELIKPHVVSKNIKISGIDTTTFEFGGKEFYQFTKDEAPFTLSIESVEEFEFKEYVSLIIGSVEVTK